MAMEQLGESARAVIRDMSVTQRISIVMAGLTVAIFLLAMVFIGSVSQDRGEIALPITVEPGQDYDQVKAVLDEAGIAHTYKHQIKKVFVPVDLRDKAYLLLASENLLDDSSHTGFEEMIGKVQVSHGRYMQETMMRVALQNELARMIASIDSVEGARVLIAQGESKVFGPQVNPRASVQVKTRRGKLFDQAMADTVIRLVAAAKAGLDPTSISVVDQTGRHFYARDENDMGLMAAERLELQRKEEEKARAYVEHLVRSFYPGAEAFTFLDIQLDVDRKVINQREVLEGQVLRANAKKLDTRSSKPVAGETGTQPNVVRQVGTEGGAAEISTTTQKETDNEYALGYRDLQHVIAPGSVLKQSVSVILHLPPVYEVDEAGRVVLDEKTGDPIPTADSQPELPQEKIALLQQQIFNALGMDAKSQRFEDVKVQQVKWELWRDTTPRQKTLGGIFTERLLKHMNVFVLAGCALLGLLLIWLQIRRATPAEELPQPEADMPEAPSPFSDMSDEERNNASFQKMRDKITEIVSEDPQKAASLVRRWLVME